MSDETASKNILIVDDEEIIVDILMRRFERMGFSVHAALDRITAIDILENQQIDVIMCDVLLPNGTDGEAVLHAALAQHPESHFVAMSGNIMSDESVQKLLQQGVDLFIKKPFLSLGEVADQVAELVSHSE